MVLSGLAFFKAVSVLPAESSDSLFRFCGSFAGSAGLVCFLVVRAVDNGICSETLDSIYVPYVTWIVCFFCFTIGLLYISWIACLVINVVFDFHHCVFCLLCARTASSIFLITLISISISFCMEPPKSL